ncbi:hypothetical protein EJB05_12629, partial [Eragrostis curvula]
LLCRGPSPAQEIPDRRRRRRGPPQRPPRRPPPRHPRRRLHNPPLAALAWPLARLPALAFHAACPDTLDAALAAAAASRRPSPPSLLSICCDSHTQVDAARLAPARFIISDVIIRAEALEIAAWTVELPCFDRTASISLEAFGARFVLTPAEGGFLALESLSLRFCDIDLEDLLPCCSRLRKLQITDWTEELLKVHSPSLEELDIDVHLPGRLWIRHVDVVAPVLKRLRFASGSRWSGANDFTLLCSAPMVEDLHWRWDCGSDTDRFGVRWRLFNLTLSTANFPHGQQHCLHRLQVIHTLSLSIAVPFSVSGDEDQNFGQQITKMIPVTNVHVLELPIKTEGHVYGAMVLHLLGMCTFVRSLRLKLREDTNRCSVKCPCDHPFNWRSLNVSLTDLKDIKSVASKAKVTRLIC